MKKEFTRRAFLKGSAAAVAATAAAGAMNLSVMAEEEMPSVEEDDIFAESTVEDVTEDMISETKDYDVVVIGAGASGTAAAMAAYEAGAKVAVLQKEVTAMGQGRTGAGFLLEENDDVALMSFAHYTNGTNNWRSDISLLKAYMYKSGEAVKAMEAWATEAGFPPYNVQTQEFEFVEGHKAKSYAIQFGPKPKTTYEAVTAIAEWAADKIDYYYSTPGVSLVKEDGKVVAAIGKTADGEYIRFNAAKGVILATGDYQNNKAMCHKYIPDADKFARKQANRTGDGDLMGMKVGAVMEPIGHCRMIHDMDSGMMWDEPFLAVNENGERFTNEKLTFVQVNNILRYQPGDGRYTQIFDSTYFDQATEWGGKPVPYEQLAAFIDKDDETADGSSVQSGVVAALIDTHECDTIEALAEEIGLPVEAVVNAVNRYNELCESGMDTDFGKDPKYLKPIMTPPFYGIHKWMRLSAIMSGLIVNENAQCLDAEGNVIPGLYACGNNSGCFYGSVDYPMHLNGLSLGRAYTFGYIAGQHAAMQ